MTPLPESKRLAIVGAGMAGLTLSRQLSEFRPVILEKSHAIGGRVATRRSDAALFDHGAQFLAPECSDFLPLRDWQETDFIQPWGPSGSWASSAGMNSLAKVWASGSDIRFQRRVVEIKRQNSLWCLLCEDQSREWAENLVITAPLPQTITLFESSHLPIPDSWRSVSYAMALVGLCEWDTKIAEIGVGGMAVNLDGDIQAVFDQKAKKVSPTSAWTVVMSPKWSAANFDRTDDENVERIVDSVKRLAGSKPQRAQLKKWRYAYPETTLSEDYWWDERLRLGVAGDAFSKTGDLVSALRSATKLSEKLRSYLV